MNTGTAILNRIMCSEITTGNVTNSSYEGHLGSLGKKKSWMFKAQKLLFS